MNKHESFESGENNIEFNYDGRELLIPFQDNMSTHEDMEPLLRKLSSELAGRAEVATLYDKGLQMIFKEGAEPKREEIEAILSK